MSQDTNQVGPHYAVFPIVLLSVPPHMSRYAPQHPVLNVTQPVSCPEYGRSSFTIVQNQGKVIHFYCMCFLGY